MPDATPPSRLLQPGEVLVGGRVRLRLLTEADCTPRYLGWLEDPQVNQYLETRWSPQSLDSIRGFVRAMLASADSYLFGIHVGERHIGNIKLGPINARHAHADVSYFIGERSEWGRGYASDAIAVVTWFAFTIAGLHRVQAGLYAGNVGSGRALEKAGFKTEGRFVRQLRGPAGWEDHLWYGLTREDWHPASVVVREG
jgi:ribosomal-protein-alanine N-acetyltransferase